MEKPRSKSKSRKKSSPPPQDGSNVARRIVSFMEAMSQSRNGFSAQGSSMCKFDSVLDVGCGDGHSTMQFAPYFRKATGIDKSKAQIARAEEYSDSIKASKNTTAIVRFQVACGERMPFKDASQDLVCFSRSFHWMELMSDALREARRVLKPDGCLAMYCTGFPTIKLHESCRNDGDAADHADLDKKSDKLLDDFFRHTCEMHPRSTLAVDDKYQRIFDAIAVEQKPRKGSKFILINDKHLAIHKKYVTLSEFAQMIRSYAGYKCTLITMQKTNPESTISTDNDPLVKLLMDLKSAWIVTDLSDDDVFLDVTWDVSLILSTRPKKRK